MQHFKNTGERVHDSELEREDEINLLDYWNVIRKGWKIIAYVFGAFVITAVIVSLIMPEIYQARTSIIPVEPAGSSFSSALQNLSSLPFVGGMVPGIGGASTDKLMAVLESRTIAENVIKALDLVKVFFDDDPEDPSTLQDAVKFLRDRTELMDDKKGVIAIAVEFTDPTMASRIANQYTTALEQFLNENALSMSKRNRFFIEGNLEEVKGKLKRAEEAMTTFQTDKRIVAIDAQTEAAVQVVADLKAQIMAKEVQLGVIGQFATSTNPDVLRIKDELKELKKQLSMIESEGTHSGIEAMPSLAEAPELGLGYIRLKRGALIQEKLFELLTQQYEMAMIEESKDEIAFQVIDKAIPPEKRARPKRKLIVLMAGFVSIFIGIFGVFFLEYIENIKETKKEEVGE